MLFFKILTLLLLFYLNLTAQNSNFNLITQKSGAGNTILIFSGIQGDEPGAFMANSALSTHYQITKGNLILIPNLNPDSILASSRGVYGDMNRKFLKLDSNDPDYQIISKVKELILDRGVDAIINMHDGSGFYREKYINSLKNPHRWGQSLIIDQANLNVEKFGNLKEIADRASKEINKKLLRDSHKFGVKNTHTKDGDIEMEKSLTYFAIKNSKPAFAIEASKELNLKERVYYHLLALESLFREFGVEFERDFELNLDSIEDILYKDIEIIFDLDKIKLDLTNIRSNLYYFPLKRDRNITFKSKCPVVNIDSKSRYYSLYIGNRRVTNLHPQYFEYDYSLNSIEIEIDKKLKRVKLGEIVEVNSTFSISKIDGYRVNVIGYVASEQESDIEIFKSDFLERFSIDRDATTYRVEIYRKDKKRDKFAGMILIKFKGE